MSSNYKIQELPHIDFNKTTIDMLIHPNAFELNDNEKISKIAHHFADIIHLLGLDLTDDSLSGTPQRVAKMFVKEIFSGLNPTNKPEISLFENEQPRGIRTTSTALNVSFCTLFLFLNFQHISG